MYPDATVRVVDVYPYVATADGPRFLILRRAAGHVYAGQWRMVGGKIDEGETGWQAALRELKEETGATPLRTWALPSINHFYDWRRDTIALIPAFAVELPTDALTLDAEHDEAAWLPAPEAAARLAWPEQQRLLLLTASLLERGGVPPELFVSDES